MARSDYRTLVDRGRKAGLNTAELYRALATCKPSSREVEAGGRDGNGFTAGYDAAGHPVYSPAPAARGA